MNADPKLIAMARQLGTLIKAYGREGFADGHAQLELMKAFQDGMNVKEGASVILDLPLTKTHSSDRSLPPFRDDPFDLEAATVLRLEIMPFVVDFQKRTNPDATGTYAGQAWASARFDSDGEFVVDDMTMHEGDLA